MEEKPEDGEEGTGPIPGEYGIPIPRELMFRELGFNGPFSRHSVGKAIVSGTLKTKAVHTMSTKNTLKKKNFKLPAGARTTFHMAFSPDGTKVASCHGDHNVYVSDITTMKVEQTLAGHPRTPWCVVFHPTQNDVLASGCLAGHVRVWDLNGGSELLVCDSGTVIASLSFHPTVRLLAIATFNEIIFWDWALGPFPLARTSTGNSKEKVRLVRFDRLGHNLMTGITNFPNPPGGGGGGAGGEGRRGGSERNRNPFFRPNILSRTPQPTHGLNRPFSPTPPVGLLDENEVGPPASPTPPLSVVTDALSERQERFQQSYRQLVSHYEGLVQNYQQFIRTRLGGVETPPVLEFLPTSDSEDGSPDASNDSPPIDIVISENPSLHHVDPTETEQVDSPPMVVVEDDEIPGPSHRFFPRQPEPPPVMTIEENLPEPSTSTAVPQPRNSNDLRSIQTLEQNILQMQNLCSQARRDSSNFPVEPVHIRELRTIRRHLEVLQDQTRRLQSSIRHTLSSLAHGTGGLEGLRGRLISLIPGGGTSIRNPPPPPSNPTPPSTGLQRLVEAATYIEGNRMLAEELRAVGRNPPIADSPASPAPAIEPEDLGTTNARQLNLVEDLIGRTITNALGGRGRTAPSSSRVPPVVPMDYERTTPPTAPPPPIPPPIIQQSTVRLRPFQVLADGGAGRFARDFITEAVQEHSRFCPYGEGNLGRPPSRMRTVTDRGEMPLLHVWPTVDTGYERGIRSYRLLGIEGRIGHGIVGIRNPPPNIPPLDRNNNNNREGAGGGFPSFGNWMGQGPPWMNNDLGVRVYLTVRQFNERINSLRTERDQLLAEREQLLTRRARVTTALARAERAARARERDWPETWQRNFNSGVALVPSNVREGSRNYGRSVSSRTGTQSAQTQTGQSTPGSSTSVTPNEVPSSSPSSAIPVPGGSRGPRVGDEGGRRGRYLVEVQGRRDPPLRLDGNFQRTTFIRLGDDFIPVYSHLRERDIPQQSVFVYPIGLFLEGSGWSTTSIAIHLPHYNREDEESMMEFRRTESLIRVITPAAEAQMDPRTPRFRVDYDSTQLTLHVAQGFSLTFIQPGLTLLDAITTMAHFQRPRENSGRVYITHLSPFLDAIERIFGYRRRREGGSGGGVANPNYGGGATLRLSTVLQPGPYSLNRAVHYSIRARRENPGGSTSRQLPTQGQGGEEGVSETNGSTLPIPNPTHRHHVNVRLRRDLIRDWERSVSVYRSGAPPPPPRIHPRNEEEEEGEEIIPPSPPPIPRTGFESNQGSGGGEIGEWRRFQLMDWRRHFRNTGRQAGTVPPSGPNTSSTTPQEGDGSESASLASTRRVIRLAVAAAASSVLRRPHTQVSYTTNPPNYIGIQDLSYGNNPSRAVESRIERVLNERGNRGDIETQQISTQTQTTTDGNNTPEESRNIQGNSRGPLLYSVWGSQQQGNEHSGMDGPPRTSASPELPSATLRGRVGGSRIEDGGYRFRFRQSPSTSGGQSDVRGVVTSARPLRRSYAQMSEMREREVITVESDETETEEEEEPLYRRMRILEPIPNPSQESSQPLPRFRRRFLRSPDYRLRHQFDSDVSGVLRRRRDSFPPRPQIVDSYSLAPGAERATEGEPPEALPPTSSPLPEGVDENGVGSGNPIRYPRGARRLDLGHVQSARRGGTHLPFLFRRESRPQASNSTETATSSAQVYYRRRNLPGREPPPQNPLNIQQMEELPPGARFYPGYIPEIVITPRARPPNYYTLDASTTAFLSSRIQKWDFSSFQIPNLGIRDEGLVVRECSLHSDACLDLSTDGDFMAVCIPSDSGSYSAVGIYSIRDESLGDVIHMYHFEQNTVSVSISPSSDYIVVGYAGRGGPLYRFVHPTRAIGQVVCHYRKIGKILSLTRDGEGGAKLVSVKELFTDNQSTLMSVNCMHWVPISGYGIIYGTNTGELVLLS